MAKFSLEIGRRIILSATIAIQQNYIFLEGVSTILAKDAEMLRRAIRRQMPHWLSYRSHTMLAASKVRARCRALAYSILYYRKDYHQSCYMILEPAKSYAEHYLFIASQLSRSALACIFALISSNFALPPIPRYFSATLQCHHWHALLPSPNYTFDMRCLYTGTRLGDYNSVSIYLFPHFGGITGRHLPRCKYRALIDR